MRFSQEANAKNLSGLYVQQRCQNHHEILILLAVWVKTKRKPYAKMRYSSFLIKEANITVSYLGCCKTGKKVWSIWLKRTQRSDRIIYSCWKANALSNLHCTDKFWRENPDTVSKVFIVGSLAVTFEVVLKT